jgi:hypothetical protein
MASDSHVKSEASALDAIWPEFSDAVNMTVKELGDWLQTDQSHSAGITHPGDDETVGHHSGRQILQIKQKKKSELTDADVDHMHKVVGYVHRHLAQGGPKNDTEHSRWRYSLMNWGHDPLKERNS